MKKLFKIHKFAGLTAGLVLLTLGLTGFLLDHKNWSWLYEVKVNNSFLPQSTIKKEAKLYQTHLEAFGKTFVATGRGIYTKQANIQKISLDIPTHNILFNSRTQTLFAATSEGIYSKNINKPWAIMALEGSYVNAMSMSGETIFASVDKKELFLVDTKTAEVTSVAQPDIKFETRDISLSRFVRDLHYGRGLFDDGWSLLLNDIAALYLILLAASGYVMFAIIRKQRKGLKTKKHWLKPLTKLHANPVTLFLIIPFFILLVTGVFLDHNSFFRGFLKSTKVPSSIQPPVYESLHEDIWSIDYDGKSFKIGNRFGIFASDDLKQWKEVSKGFAYKMMRHNNKLYVSGMGAPNRIQVEDGSFSVLPKTPHMFKSIQENEVLKYYRSLPLKYENTSLYTILLTLHDGTFFASWWIWINDYAALMLLILFITGSTRYAVKKRWFSF